jgi:hypothetical protein
MIDGLPRPHLFAVNDLEDPYESKTAFPRRRPAIQSYKMVDKYIPSAFKPSYLNVKASKRTAPEYFDFCTRMVHRYANYL